MTSEPIKYKKKWRRNSLNKPFWNEVLVGRTITKVIFGEKGIVALKLDNGEIIYLKEERTLYVKCESE